MTCHGKVIYTQVQREVIACEKCGYHHVLPMYTETELETFYENHYAESTPSHLFAQKVLRISKVKPGGRVLDIGCWDGTQLAYFKEAGWDCTGTELNKKAAREAEKKGVQVYQISIRAFFDRFADERWDVINVAYILEHIPAPREFLARIHGNLAVGGILVIEVPNDFSPLQIAYTRHQATDPYWVTLPDHLNYFDTQSLESLAVDSGFEILVKEVSFPMELFLLMGDDYVKDRSIGPGCFQKVVKMEEALLKNNPEVLGDMYAALYTAGIGRSLILYCRKS